MTSNSSAAWCRHTTLAALAVFAALAPPAHAQRSKSTTKSAKVDADRTDRTDSLALRKIFDEALLRGESYENLRYLTGTIVRACRARPKPRWPWSGAKPPWKRPVLTVCICRR